MEAQGSLGQPVGGLSKASKVKMRGEKRWDPASMELRDAQSSGHST